MQPLVCPEPVSGVPWTQIVAAIAAVTSSIIAAVSASSSIRAIKHANKLYNDQQQDKEEEKKFKKLSIRHEYYGSLVVNVCIKASDDFRRSSIKILAEGTTELDKILKVGQTQHKEVDSLLDKYTDQFNETFYVLATVIKGSAETWHDASLIANVEKTLESLQDEITNAIDKSARNSEQTDFKAIVRNHTAALLKVIMDHDPFFADKSIK